MHNYKKIENNMINSFKNEFNNNMREDEILKIKSKYLGKNGILKKELISKIKNLKNEDKNNCGSAIKNIKTALEKYTILLIQKIKIQKENEKTSNENNQFNTPGISFKTGTKHLLNQIIEKIYIFFKFYNFSFYSGAEIDTVDYNFDKLNIPKKHPARDENDSFYINKKIMMRTQCTNVTSYYLEKNNKLSDIRVVSVGNVYRRDTNDATHSHQFMQIDGVCVGSNHNLVELKTLLTSFCKFIFGKKTKIRLRPSYFPFTSISLEVDVSCSNCEQKGCFLCKKTGWIEIMGAGMLHKNVLLKTGNNPEKKQGFAFGIGIERIAMIKYKINDIRHFYTNNLRFTSQFKNYWNKNED